jgi:hypothetical protein
MCTNDKDMIILSGWWSFREVAEHDDLYLDWGEKTEVWMPVRFVYLFSCCVVPSGNLSQSVREDRRGALFCMDRYSYCVHR